MSALFRFVRWPFFSQVTWFRIYSFQCRTTMFPSSFRRSRRNLSAKLIILLLILLMYIVISRLFSSREIPNTAAHIIFNLRALNHSIPSFIAESHELSNELQGRREQMLEQVPVHEIKENNVPKIAASVEAGINMKKPIDQIQLDESEVLNLRYEEIIREDEEKIIPGLGDDGEAVNNVPFISDDELERIMKKEAFNKPLSDRISLTRRLPDARHPMCASVRYDEDLPSASVIIIFINEAWSTLLRTIHSTLIRSPEKYLKEIILVDDCSTRAELKGKLDYYLRTRLPPKVKLVRLKERSGLIRARLVGAEAATGDVLVFLDSHCECIVGWLEPLLQRIKDQEKAVVCPIIDVINDKNFAYMYSADLGFQIGGFTWAGHFTWIPIPEFEEKRRKSPIAPARSPTMAGGLFAINRKYFWDIGSYDRDMDVWGGENLEMSFRVWQCGGVLEIVPCSRVGHIFRSFHPYSFPGGKDTHGINTARVAEVWMDDYKRLFYLHRPDLKKEKIGSITERKDLRERLKCNDFHWYLKNVIPQKFVLDEGVQAYGRVKSMTRNFCFDNLNRPEDIGLYYCHNVLYPSQLYSLSDKGELRQEELCAQVEKRHIIIPGMVSGAKGNVTMVECDGNTKQKWVYENLLIRHVSTGLCVHAYGAYVEASLTVAECRRTDINFKWQWEYVRESNGEYRKHELP